MSEHRWLRVATTGPADQAGYSRWLKERVFALEREMAVLVRHSGGKVSAEPSFDLLLTMHQLVTVEDEVA